MLVLAASLIRAYVAAPRPLTSQDVLGATRSAVLDAVDTAVRLGGLEDAEAWLRDAIVTQLERDGFAISSARIRRLNDLDPWRSFHFYVNASGVTVRFDIEGTPDPLLAIRTGVRVPIRPDPLHPYVRHREPGVLRACLEHQYYHASPDAPDLFARLENRTADSYHAGFEALLTDGSRLAVDHTYLETGVWELSPSQAARYGL